MSKHNLDITTYTIKELLDLYELPKQPTAEQMQKARKKMLMIHPDKSRLPQHYFTFYQQAFQVVQQYHADMNRQNQPMTESATTYRAPEADNREQVRQQIHTQQKDQGAQKFNSKFNTLFEEQGGVDKQRVERQQQRFGWFSQHDDPSLLQKHSVKSAAGLNAAFDQIRPTATAMVQHREFRPLTQRTGVSYVDDDEDDEQAAHNYIESEAFSKLKYDDIRRVHKDQTVLPVGESDLANRQQYASVEDYKKARDTQTLSAMEKAHAQKLLEEEERQKQAEYEQRWGRMQQRTQQHEKNNGQVLSSFLLLGSSQQNTVQQQPQNTVKPSVRSSEPSFINRSRVSCMRS